MLNKALPYCEALVRPKVITLNSNKPIGVVNIVLLCPHGSAIIQMEESSKLVKCTDSATWSRRSSICGRGNESVLVTGLEFHFLLTGFSLEVHCRLQSVVGFVGPGPLFPIITWATTH